MLRVVSTTRQKQFGGFYHLVPDQQTNGMPMWKCGKKMLYSNTDGNWVIASNEDCIFFNAGNIMSAVHGGLMPDVMTGWRSIDGAKFQVDTGISVTTDGGSGAANATAAGATDGASPAAPGRLVHTGTWAVFRNLWLGNCQRK
eukprot:gene19561-biopygen23180